MFAFALTLLSIGNVCAEEVDTLKIVDVEEVLIIAAPKENRKLRELPNAVTLLSQQDMQAAQVNSIKNLTALVPNIFIPDYGSRLTSAVYIRGIGSRINTPSVGLYLREHSHPVLSRACVRAERGHGHRALPVPQRRHGAEQQRLRCGRWQIADRHMGRAPALVGLLLRRHHEQHLCGQQQKRGIPLCDRRF